MTNRNTTRLRYAHLEGLAIRFSSTEGWCFNPLRRCWEQEHPAEIYHRARLLSRAEFLHRFRNEGLPHLRRSP